MGTSWYLVHPRVTSLVFNPRLVQVIEKKSKHLELLLPKDYYIEFLPQKCIVYIDNYFNSLPLLKTLSENGINCKGTTHNDRVEKAPLHDMKRDPRGSYHALQDDRNWITLIKWHGNSVVTVATNICNDNVLGLGKCSRGSKNQKKCGKCSKFRCVRCNVGLHPKNSFLQFQLR